MPQFISDRLYLGGQHFIGAPITWTYGDVIKHTAGGTGKAKADSLTDAQVIGLTTTFGSDSFPDIKTHGYIAFDPTLLVAVGPGLLTDGAQYYLSPTTAGAWTTTVPSTSGQVIKPLFIAVATYAVILNVGPSTLIP